METQTHAILNLALLRWFFKKGRFFKTDYTKIKNFNAIVVFGSILPDLPMFLFYIFYKLIQPTPEMTIWRDLYFDSGWQIFFDFFNSIPIFLAILFLAIYLRSKSWIVFSSANLLHFIGDFFVHQEDAHAHFFPLNGYKFISPVSYWQASTSAFNFAIVEKIIILVAAILVYKHIKSKWGKILLVLAVIFSMISYLLWWFLFSTG